jgi:pre-mRNA-splicing factor 18
MVVDNTPCSQQTLTARRRQLSLETMDFASLMSAQITKSKSSTSSDNKARYLKRSQIEAEREAAYAAEQAKIEAERDERAAKKRKFEEEEEEKNKAREEKKRRLAEESKARREEEEAKQERLRRKRLGLPELPDPKEADKEGTPLAEDEVDIPDEDLLSKLRALDEPVILFGESHKSRLRRYRKLTSRSLTPTLSTGPIPTSLQPVPEAEMLIPSKPPPANTPERTFLFRQLCSYFTLLLTEWSLALSHRDPTTKASHQGRLASTNLTQTITNLTPLFRKFESQDLPDSILTPICSIVRDAQQRRYVAANDGYLRLSIGKAAWPIGVTMVGIHERSAREKLHESDAQAHIMSDEVTRKYLQAIKRCLSFAQTRWPPEDVGQLMG